TGCAGCHRLTDPPGLGLEHFDGLGQLRTMENGARIDVTADLNGAKFEGAPGLGKVLHDNPEVITCLVRKVFAYGVGRKTEERDEGYLSEQAKVFTDSEYRLPDLLVQIASSREFFKVVAPSGLQHSSSTPATATFSLQRSGGIVK